MLTILYFAKLREALALSSQQIEFVAGESLVDLVHRLVALGDERWQQLLDEEVVYAVNQQIVDRSRKPCDGDEIAFFPPVTGG